jgi:hypothetical protein
MQIDKKAATYSRLVRKYVSLLPIIDDYKVGQQRNVKSKSPVFIKEILKVLNPGYPARQWV